MLAEVVEPVVEEIGRVLGPVEAEPVEVGIGAAEVADQGVGVRDDVGAGEAAVLREPARGETAVGEPGPVVLVGPAELDAVARRDGRLHLEVDADVSAPGRPG